MRRRDVIGMLGAAALPLTAHAQSAQPVVGFLSGGSAPAFAPHVAGFLGELKEAGFVSGQNLTVEYRWAEGRYERLPALATELVQRSVHVLATAGGTVTVRAARSATSTISIVFSISDDPVATCLVASLNRPGGNMTGVARLGTEVLAKNLEFVHGLVSAVTTIGLLINQKRTDADAQSKSARNAADAVGKTIRTLHASDEREIVAAFKIVESER